MTCEECLNLLSARLDGELLPDDRVRLDAHLSECSGCRAAADAFGLQHADLRRAFLPRQRAAQDLAERVIARLPHRRSYRMPWLPVLLAAAAGFAIAFVLFHRPLDTHRAQPIVQNPTTVPTTQPEVTPPARPAPVAHLALATGKVMFCCPGDSGWSPMPTGGEVPPGTRVRTGPDVRCEFQTADGSEVRLNADTEVQIKSPRQFDVAGGQVWSTVAKAEQPFEAQAGGAVFTALGTQFDLRAQAQAAVLTVVEGSVRVRAGSSQDVLNAGQQLTVEAGGHLGGKTTIRDLALATRWVNEILVMKGRDNPEMAKRIDDLFARIGEEKMSFMYENEIRALGDHSVIPLTKYIQSDRSRNQAQKRAIAARIVSDVAPPWAIPQLIALLQDRDGEVRAAAARGLQRLTGESLGRSTDQWRDESAFACQPTVNEWQSWWQENRKRYPGVPPNEQPAQIERKARDDDRRNPLPKS
jgi:hypothetical protein